LANLNLSSDYLFRLLKRDFREMPAAEQRRCPRSIHLLPIDFFFPRALPRRYIARLRHKGPDWITIALVVGAVDLLLATVAWIIVDLALT
jgi:hypothetical protein